MATNPKLTPEELYRMGMVAYRRGQVKEAIPMFELASQGGYAKGTKVAQRLSEAFPDFAMGPIQGPSLEPAAQDPGWFEGGILGGLGRAIQHPFMAAEYATGIPHFTDFWGNLGRITDGALAGEATHGPENILGRIRRMERPINPMQAMALADRVAGFGGVANRNAMNQAYGAPPGARLPEDLEAEMVGGFLPTRGIYPRQAGR